MSFIIITVTFLAVYLASRYTPIGWIVCFVCELAAIALKHLKDELSVFKQNNVSGNVKYPGLRTMVILVFFALSLIALSADTYGSLQALTALLGGAVVLPPLPAFFEYSMAALFAATSAISGGIWLEGLTVLPEEAKIFESGTDQEQVKKFRRLVVAGFWLSVAAGVTYFTLRPFFLHNPESGTTHLLQVVVFLLLGFLLPLVASLCVYLVPLGLQTILALLARIGLLIVTILTEVCEYVVTHFGGSKPVTRTASTPPTSDATPADISGGIPAVSSHPILESEAIPMPVDVMACHFVGAESSRMVAPMARLGNLLGARKFIRAGGVIDLTNPWAASFGMGKNISIPYSEGIATLAGLQPGQEPYSVLLDRYEENLVQEFLPTKGHPSLSLFFWDCHVPACTLDILPRIKNRLGLTHTIAVALSVSPQDRTDSRVQAVLQKLVQLHTDGVITTNLVVDPSYGFAREHGVDKLREFVSQTFAALLVASSQSTANPSAIEVLQDMGRMSAFWAFSFSSADTALGTTPRRSFWLRWFSKKAVLGDLDDMLRVSQVIRQNVVSEHTAQAFDEPVSTTRPFYLVNMLPLRLDDVRFSQGAKQLSRDIRKEYPLARTVTVSANGLRLDDRIPAVFRVGTACLYPLSCL